MQPNRQNENFWIPLDNAAKIFPAILSSELTAVFRISVVLKEPIHIETLFDALGTLENRFPYYKVQLKKGFFWHYLEHKDIPFSIEVDDKLLCRAFKSGKQDLLFRILVIENTISVEFSHILTDGSGALAFLKSIVLTYFEKCGERIPADLEYHRPEGPVHEMEYEDSYQRYFQKNLPSVPKYPSAFHVPFELKRRPRFATLVVRLPLQKVLRAAKEKNGTITVYLVAVYLMALQEIYQEMSNYNKRKASKILRILVPVNLRSAFPSKTMRNFSLFVMPEIDLRLGRYTLDETIKRVYLFMQLETDKKLINKTLARNVGIERRLEIRSTPLFIKSLIMNFMFHSLGTSQYGGTITNLGKVGLSPELNELISYFIFTPPPPHKILKVNCGVIGFENNLIMSFGNISKSRKLEQKFMQILKEQGIPSEVVKTNQHNYGDL